MIDGRIRTAVSCFADDKRNEQKLKPLLAEKHEPIVPAAVKQLTWNIASSV